MRTTWHFSSAGQLHFGRGAVVLAGECARRIGAKRALVVADKTLVELGVVTRVTEALGIEAAVFDGGEAEPSVGVVEAALSAARDVRPDVVVGVGGGSNMDVAKYVATLLAHPGGPLDFVGDDRVPGPVVPLICVPTTAGTGSEVSGSAVCTDTNNRVKVSMLSPWLRPAFAVVDPDLTRSCPPSVTAHSGIDALAHAVEAFTAVDNAAFPLPPGERTVYQGRTPMGDLMAGEAIRLVGRFLERAVADGSDTEAREGMALAATLGGLAFSNVGVALVHAMEYPVGGAAHVSHGEGNGLLLPAVMRFNTPGREREMAQIAAWLGADDGDAPAAVERLNAAIGVRPRLSMLGVTAEMLPELAAKAFAVKRLLRVNPRVPTLAEVEAIYRAAL